MAIFKNYFDIGRDQSTEKFLHALEKYKSYHTETLRKNETLMDGAVHALREGRPQNVQTAVLKIKNYAYTNGVAGILHKISEKSGNPIEDIGLALGKVPAEERQAVLNNALNSAVKAGLGGEDFYAVLIKAGAKAHAEIGGYPSIVLVTAVTNKAPISVIKLLHEKGASFDDALITMHSQGAAAGDIDRLKFFQEKVVGAPPAADISPQLAQILQQLQEQISDLTEAVKGMQKEPVRAPRKTLLDPQPPKAP